MKRIVFVGLMVLGLYGQVAQAAEEGYEFIWKQPSIVWYFGSPNGVAVDSSGNVYVADTGNHRIQKFNSSGTFITKWGSYGTGNSQFNSPRGVVVDSFGNVYVADPDNHRIQKFNPSGDFIAKWGSKGTENGQFYYPWGIAVDSSGNVYVADTGNHRIQKFNSSGTFITKWGSYGTGNSQFNSPRGVAVDSSGNVYVADHYNDRIQKFSSNGTFITKWGIEGTENGQFKYPHGVTVDSSGNLYVADTCNNRIQKFSSSGTFTAKWGSYGSGDGQFDYPNGVAIDSSGNLYVADTYNQRIQKFNFSGIFIATWGNEGAGNGRFRYPEGVDVDSSGNLYVADTGNHRIQKFSSSGIFIATWGNEGAGNGYFRYPSEVAVDSSGNVYVADPGNDYIQKFNSSGTFITRWGGYGDGDSQFIGPRGVAVDSSGNVYVADRNNHRIQKFSSSGTFITNWGSWGTGNGRFRYPEEVAVDSSGNVYVADYYNNRIQKFDSSGNFITKWGGYGTENGQFYYPWGVAVDSSGNVYVADTDNHRIQKFDASGGFITKWGSYGTGDGQFKYPYGVAVDSSGNLYVADRDNNRIQKFRPSTPTPYGSLSIASTPSGAKIYLDGVDTGSVTTQTFTNISAETHTIKLALSGYQDWYGTTTVIAGSTTYVYATLTLIQGIPISLSLSPKTATTTADGSITFMAIAKDSNGNTWTVTCKTIFSGNDPIGTMSANIYYPGKVGTRIITATYTTLMATATVSVSHGSATIISISPQDLSTYVGVSTNYSATGTDTDGNSFGVLATFAITAGAGTFTDNKFEAGSAGTYEITAHYLNLIATTTVKIEPHGAAVKISLKISTNTTTADGAIACTVYGTDTNNVCWDATDVSTFTTTDQKGTFTNNIYSPGKVGIWVIKAELGTLNATATVTVIHGLPVKLDIAPAITTLTADSIQTYKGTATDSDGNQWDATANITWSKNDPVGTMTANIYYPGKIGTWTITGTINGIVGTATVNVISGAFTNLKIVSLPATTTTSATFTITVTLCDNDGNPYSGILAMTNTTQSITPSTITLISGTGTATAKITKSPEGGTDTITVAYGSITATRTIRVFISSQYGGTITGSCVIIDIGTISATCFARITTSANEPTLPGGIKFAGTVYNIDLFDEQGNRVGTEAGQMGTVTVRLLYLDDNNDGIVDGTNIQELDLSIYHLENGTWTALLPTTVNDTKNFALAYVTHFSTFTLAGTPTVTPFAINNNDVYVYPNPYKEGKTNFDGDYIYFSQVSQEAVIKIYNIVGELIKTIDKCPYEWNISSENIASGVYIYVVTGGGGGKSVGKIGIVK